MRLLCATNRVPVSYEFTPASTAEVRLIEELLDGAGLVDGAARRLLGDLWPFVAGRCKRRWPRRG